MTTGAKNQALRENLWVSHPRVASGTPFTKRLHGEEYKAPSPSGRRKAGMGVGTRNEALDPHPNLPPARRKAPDSLPRPTCHSVDKSLPEKGPAHDKEDPLFVRQLPYIRSLQRPTVSPEDLS
jgi:hypothetical protein